MPQIDVGILDDPDAEQDEIKPLPTGWLQHHRQSHVRLKHKSNSPARVDSTNETIYKTTGGTGVLLGNYNKATKTGISLKDFQNYEQSQGGKSFYD